MNKTVIVYHSKTGFTKRYAEWIAEALSCEAIPYAKRKTLSLAQYDTVLYGAGFHAGTIRGIKWLKEQLPSLSGKKVCVFTTGASPVESPDVPKALRQNFSDEEWEKVHTFYLPAGLAYEKMGAVDKLMMAGMRAYMKKQEGENSDAYHMICHSYDHSSKDAILPIVDYCKD